MAGLWRYADGKWDRLLDEFYAIDVAVDPTNPSRLALATSQDPYHDICPATGVWVSSDAGKTWAQADANLAMTRVMCVAFNPHDPEQLVCGTWGGGYYVGRWPTAATVVGTRHYETTDKDRQLVAVPNLSGELLRNGPMSEGKELPAGWEGRWGRVTTARDTAVFKVGPASLRVETDAAGGSGQGFQMIEGGAGQRVRLRGWVKSQGDVKVNVAIQSFDLGWSRNSFDQVKFLQGDTDWTPFDKEVLIPDWAARYNVQLLVEGKGRAWLDEVSLTQVR
jgi:hypothetical protein